VILDGKEDKALARLLEERLLRVRCDGEVADKLSTCLVDVGDMRQSIRGLIDLVDHLFARCRDVGLAIRWLEKFLGRVEVDGRERSSSPLARSLDGCRHDQD
jgi:hypothetical protein